MGVKLEVTKKITVNGQTYEGLDQVPAEVRAAFEQAIASGGTATNRTIRINGKTYGSWSEVPAPYRLLVRGITALAMRNVGSSMAPAPELRAEPAISLKKAITVLVLAALAYMLLRTIL